MTLDAAILRLQVHATNAGAKYAPENPVESASVYPFSIVYPASGKYTGESFGLSKDIHQIAVEMHCAPRINLPTAVETAKNLLDELGHRIVADPTLGGAVDTVLLDEGIPYTFGMMPYADIEDVGFKFLVSVKIRAAAVST